MTKFIFTSLLTFCFGNIEAQTVDRKSLVDSIENQVTGFFFERRVLNRSIVGDNRNYIYASEIREHKTLGYNKNGIYAIGVFQSHAEEGILIKEDDKICIFSLKDIKTIMQSIIQFGKDNQIPNPVVFDYLRYVMKLYEKHYSTDSAVEL